MGKPHKATFAMTIVNFMTDISIEDERWLKDYPAYDDLIYKAIEGCFKHSDIYKPEQPVEISISLVNDDEIKILNKEYRGKDKSTNVLSFPQIEDWSEASSDLDTPVLLLGDIVVALETILREAQEQYKTKEDHFIHMMIHSVLHLLGYDHEVDDDAVIMEALEIEVLRGLNIKNPYQSL